MMINLCIDIGNTRTKAAIFKDNLLIHIQSFTSFSIQQFHSLTKEYTIQSIMLSSVAKEENTLVSYLEKQADFFVNLSHTTPIPITNVYATPQTLGKDRLAAVIGANELYPAHNVLVIDIGTCITYDFIDHKARYHGGNISPGVYMKLRALHTFTGRLPLIKMDKLTLPSLVGNNTENAIISGVILGTLSEIEQMITNYSSVYQPLQVIFTGGDAHFFESQLKNSIFVSSNLVLLGLNKILNYNAAKAF